MTSSESVSASGSNETQPQKMPPSSEAQRSSSSAPGTPPAERPAAGNDRARLAEALRKPEEPEGQGGEASAAAPSGPDHDIEGSFGAEGGGGEQAGPVDSSGPLTPKALAEKLDMDVADLYEMEITTGDGETVTLDTLKNAYASRRVAERGTAEREAALDRREADIADERSTWAILAEDGRVPADLVERAQEGINRRREREAAIARRLYPELNEPGAMDAERDAIVELMAPHGFKPAEVSISDHRELKFFRHIRSELKELARLRRETEQRPPKSATPQGSKARSSNGKQVMATARAARSPRAKIAAITGSRK